MSGYFFETQCIFSVVLNRCSADRQRQVESLLVSAGARQGVRQVDGEL